MQDVAAVFVASQPSPITFLLWVYCFSSPSRCLWPQIYFPLSWLSLEHYTLVTMGNTHLCKRSAARLIRPIIPLCRRGEWTEKLWQPDANHRKQAANTLGAYQPTQTCSKCTPTHKHVDTFHSVSISFVYIVCVHVCVYFATVIISDYRNHGFGRDKGMWEMSH